MLDNEGVYVEDVNERVPPLGGADARGQSASLLVRRRIEHMRELKRLRELLDDPDFDELS